MDKNEIINWKLILIVCSVIVCVIMGVRNCFGFFLDPISLYNNSGAEPFSIGMSIQAVSWGISAFLLGMIIDKFGPQKALAFGIFCYALGVYILSNPSSNFVIYNFGLITGIGLGAGGMSTIVAIIGKTAPPEKKSMAMGVAAASASFGQFIFIAPTLFSIKTFGWQTTIVFLSIVTATLFLLIPLLKTDNKPESLKRNEKEFDFKDVIKFSFSNKNYILLILGFFTCGFHVTFIGLHLPNDLISKGISIDIAGWSLAIIGLFNIVGTLFFGWLGDRVLKKNSLAYIYLGRSIVITLFIILPPSPFLAIAFGASIGLLWLATVPLTNGVVFTFMGPKYLATLGGIVFISHQLGGLFGAWSGGKIFDIYGSYENAWWISVTLGIIAFLFHIFIQEKSFNYVPKMNLVKT
ncbi:MAG: MFS transporter [SAR116 cluster bacterium]|nr:MFS transporter [SAR116 cluster bacterium]RPH08550.1 MAG: MFS transporter [Alphaproteobacteria bacterium TMED54]